MVDYLTITDPPVDTKALFKAHAAEYGLKAIFRNRDGKQYLTLNYVGGADKQIGTQYSWHNERSTFVRQFYPDSRMTSGGYSDCTFRLNKDEVKPPKAKKSKTNKVNLSEDELQLLLKALPYLLEHRKVHYPTFDESVRKKQQILALFSKLDGYIPQ